MRGIRGLGASCLGRTMRFVSGVLWAKEGGHGVGEERGSMRGK